MRATIAFLQWLESENLTLAGLTQPDLERWIDQHPAQQLSIDNFIRWTSNRKLTTGLRTPRRRNGEPSQLLDSDGHLQQLQLCLDHDHAPHRRPRRRRVRAPVRHPPGNGAPDDQR